MARSARLRIAAENSPLAAESSDGSAETCHCCFRLQGAARARRQVKPLAAESDDEEQPARHGSALAAARRSSVELASERGAAPFASKRKPLRHHVAVDEPPLSLMILDGLADDFESVESLRDHGEGGPHVLALVDERDVVAGVSAPCCKTA
jgi:hypothetical protein